MTSPGHTPPPITPPRPCRGSALLFHGLTSSPSELATLVDSLASAGFQVESPPLAGHSDVELLRRTRLSTWTDEAERVARASRAAAPDLPLFVGGLSFGALLALHLSTLAELSIAGLVMLAPPFRLRRRFDEARLHLLSKLPENIIDSLGIRLKNRSREARLVLPRSCLRHHSVGSAVRMVRLRENLFERVGQLTTPMLIVQDPHDHLVHPDGVDPFIEAAECAEVDTIWLPGGEHELTLGPRHHEVSNTVVEFLNRLCLGR